MPKKIIYKVNKYRYAAILADKSIPPGAKVILSNLKFRCGGKYYAFPSQMTIARDIGLSDRQVRYHLQLLHQKKIITWTRQGAENPKTKNKVNSNKYDLSRLMDRIEVDSKEEGNQE